jgi:acid phosphatase family membrane protein YuiD
MKYLYLLTPFVTWLATGFLKFIFNSIKAKKFAFCLIGYGGLPSNHSAIVSSVATLIALREGVDHPAFGVAVSFAFIVILDASSLRIQVGKHAEAINSLKGAESDSAKLRERMGHTKIEILTGIFVGILVAFSLHFSSSFFCK